jgi:RimJ/RimL family protein N-acetyltransferase
MNGLLESQLTSGSEFIMPEIETSRLHLRQFSMDDLNDLFAIRSDPEVMRFIGEGQPHSLDQVRDALENVLSVWKQHGFGRWAVVHKANKKMIGWCGLAFLEKTDEIEIGYGIAKEYWGRGLTTEAAAASIKYGFEELKLNRIVAVHQAGYSSDADTPWTAFSKLALLKVQLPGAGEIGFGLRHSDQRA